MTHTAAPAFAHTSGPKSARIALVGEAWGKDEQLVKAPFVGYSGQELTRILKDVGLSRSDCFLTNVLAFQPLNNDMDTLCGKKADVGPNYAWKALRQGKYLRPEFFPEIARLKEELESVRPNLVVALGNVACWALLGTSGITSIRGTVAESSLCPGLKVLPTYHPAAVLRNWAWRPIVLADMLKAKREMEFPEIRRPRREFVVNPSLDEIDEWIARHAEHAPDLAVDTETTRGQIDMIGFSSGPSHALVIPFFNNTTFQNFWPTIELEIEARKRVQYLLTLPCPKVLQNGLYDAQYILKEKFSIRNMQEDTMLLHHALFPELPKGLGFLGSVYCNESSWKLLNRRRSDEILKKDE